MGLIKARAKEQKLGKHPGKHAPAMKNLAQPTTQRASPKNSAEATGEVVRPATPGIEDSTPAPYFSSAKKHSKTKLRIGCCLQTSAGPRTSLDTGCV